MAKSIKNTANKKTLKKPTNLIDSETEYRTMAKAEWNDTLDDIVQLQEGIGYALASHRESTGISSTSALSLVQGSGNKHVQIIQECVHIYRTTGMVKNIIDLMSDFTTEGIDIVHSDAKQQKFYKSWMERVRLKNRVEHIARTYFKEANVAIVALHGTISKKEERILIAQGAIKKENVLVTEETQKRKIPISYEIYNPVNLRKVGPIGFKTILSKIDNALVKIIKKSKKTLTPSDKLILKNTPDKFIKEIRENKKGGNVLVTLGLEKNDPNLTMMYYKKDDWEDWADPLIFAVLDDIKYKKLLRAADEEAARTIINALTIIKLGDTKNNLPPTKKEFEKFAKLLKTPTPTKTIVWNDLVTIETAYPNVDKILGKGKYEAVNNDILSGFGVSEVLVNGKGGNYASSFLSVKTLLERLETCRCEINSWLTKELRRIMKNMGWKEMPHIRFGRMNLRDENAEKQILIDLMDRNVMSPETVLQYMGENQAVETQRIENEIDRREGTGIETRSPIKKDVDPNEDENPEGRPPRDDSPQEKQRETKPQGASLDPRMILDLSSQANDLYMRSQRLVTANYCKNKGVSNKKSLLKEDRIELDENIFKVFCNLGVNYTVEDSDIIVLSSNTDELVLDKRTSEIFESLRTQNNSVATAQEVRDMRVNAFVLAQIETGNIN